MSVADLRSVFKPCFAPKGPQIKAQGNALGFRQEKQTALKGHHIGGLALQGDEYQPQKTQGCAPGLSDLGSFGAGKSPNKAV
jgi:hypothetical protein